MIDVYLVLGQEEDGMQTAMWCRKDHWDANHTVEDSFSDEYYEVEADFEEIGVDNEGDGQIAWMGMSIDDIVADMADREVNLLVDDIDFINSFIATFGRDPRA